MADYDAILVLGGGIRENGVLPVWVRSRLDRAMELYPRARYVLLLSAGTPHRPPPLDGDGFPIFESVGMARYLLEQGAEPRRLLAETISYDTLGNAYFSRIIHADPLRLKRLLVITSAFHMPRTQAVFRWVYGLRGSRLRSYELVFESVPDVGLPLDALEHRRAREAESLSRLPALRERIQTLDDFHHWLYTEHQAYAINQDLRHPLDSDTRSY